MIDLFGEQPEFYAPLVVPNHWLRQSSAPRALILYYHRISAETNDPCRLNVSPENFARQVELFSRELNCITLADLAKSLEQNTLSSRTAVITLDDGYADALHQAWPVLSHFGVPATIFVTTGNGSSPAEFWWDRLEQLLLTPDALPVQLSLSVDGERKTWHLDRGQSSLEGHEQYNGWNIHMPPPTARHALFVDLHTLLAKLSEDKRQKLLDELSQWSGSEPACRESRRTLSTDELKQLAQCDNIELGAHTISHPILAMLDDEEQLHEIDGSKRMLEQAAGTKVQSFAYPYGRRGDFSARTVELVRDAGFTAACCTVADVTWPGSDRYRLPRIPMHNCQADLLSDWLKLWF